MAKVTITIEDTESGMVQVSMTGIPASNEKPTMAHSVGQQVYGMMDHLPRGVRKPSIRDCVEVGKSVSRGRGPAHFFDEGLLSAGRVASHIKASKNGGR